MGMAPLRATWLFKNSTVASSSTCILMAATALFLPAPRNHGLTIVKCLSEKKNPQINNTHPAFLNSTCCRLAWPPNLHSHMGIQLGDGKI
jgi:hypothetical protein